MAGYHLRVIRSAYLVAAAWGSALTWRLQRLQAAERVRPAAVRHDPGAPALLLSPHLDDAVFSCWSVLTAPAELRIANVFAGIPPSGFLTPWDEWCGATESAHVVRTRLAEDRVALALAGREAANLPLLDAQYQSRRPTLAEIDAEVAAVAPAASLVYAPAAVGVPHHDHRLVREYARALAAAGMPLVLYADFPYAVRSGGWPAWVREGQGSAAHPFWGPALRGVARRADAAVAVLAPDAARAKVEAMRTYRTQFRVLDHKGELSDLAISGREVFWRLPPAAARAGDGDQPAAGGVATRAPWSSPRSVPSSTSSSS